MTTAYIAIALTVILSIVVAVLNKKSINRHNLNASSIAATNTELSKKCDTIAEDVAAKDNAVRAGMESLRHDANEQTKRAEAAEQKLSKRIDALKDATDAAISETKKQASDKTEDAYLRATRYSDQKADGAKEYSDELYDNLASQFEDRIGTLAAVLDSLNKENAQLRQELEEQKKKLNFYANIEEAAENLTVKEDSEERARALEAVRKQIMSRKKDSEAAPDAKTGEDKVRGRLDSQTVYPQDHVVGDDQRSPKQSENEAIEPPAEKSLDKEQEYARDFMDNTTENVFVTGKAGTGKSFLLDIFRLTTSKANIVLAPTGIAALNVNGATLHSTFGYYNLVNLNIDDISEDTIRLKSEKRNVLKRVKTIIIDEISMVRADTFDKIDRILKAINHSELPFGGKQLLVFGDLFQLPPVTRGQEYEYLFDKYGGIFFFHSDAYKAGNFKFIELTENHRQKGDQEFFGILNRIREGTATDADIERLNTRYTPNESVYDRYTALFPTKAEAERVNRSHMDQLESAEFIFVAKTVLDKNPNKNKSIENVFPISEELRLRLGANVMMVANDPEGRWVNGTVGIVKELSKDKVVVSFGKDHNYEVQPMNFDEQEIAYAGGKITYETVYRVMQYPIVPAYAITIHKSQGQTYDNVMCDIERCFASGQAYVALSRCASLRGLHLKSHITPASIKVDHEVLDFYHSQLDNNLLQ